MKSVLTGNEAAAHAVRCARAQVVSAYPITPQTTIIETLADLISRKQLDAKFIMVESEHSAMAGCIGASSIGARTFTATSSQGLLLMHELLHWAAAARLPIVMVNVNRALAPGWSIWTDQNDSLSQRDTGWMQFYCENNQEVIDTVIQAYKISERVLLPSMVVLDAFVLSHTAEIVDTPSQEMVDRFLPPFNPAMKLDTKSPCSFGALLTPDIYQEFRFKMQDAMERAIGVTKEIDEEWGKLTGRRYGITESYRCEGAETILVATATVASTSRIVIDCLRDKGVKVGMLKIRLFRPFPMDEVRAALRGAKKVLVFDRNISYGHHGIFCQEVKSALYNLPDRERPKVFGYVGGLGGRDVTTEDIEGIIRHTMETKESGEEFTWVNLKR